MAFGGLDEISVTRRHSRRVTVVVMPEGNLVNVKCSVLAVAFLIVAPIVSPAQGIKQTSSNATDSKATNDGDAASKQPPGFWVTLLEKNPGIATIVVSSFLLPIIILFLNNRHNRQLKTIETESAIRKTSQEKELDIEFESKATKRNHENIVHSSLVKILFEVQRLHVELSGACVEFKCIEDAIHRFQEAFVKYQGIISDNQLALSPVVTNHVYAFYRLLSELLIELKELAATDSVDVAIVSAYNHAQALADEIIQIQSVVLKERNELVREFRRADMERMRNCCGRQPTRAQIAKYNALKETVEQLPPEPVEGPITKTQPVNAEAK